MFRLPLSLHLFHVLHSHTTTMSHTHTLHRMTLFDCVLTSYSSVIDIFVRREVFFSLKSLVFFVYILFNKYVFIMGLTTTY